MGDGGAADLVAYSAQTRRNDRVTGVKNRAQWVVQGVYDEGVSLASASDSGEMRHVPTAMREHL